jgi:hypothetical protein
MAPEVGFQLARKSLAAHHPLADIARGQVLGYETDELWGSKHEVLCAVLHRRDLCNELPAIELKVCVCVCL